MMQVDTSMGTETHSELHNITPVATQSACEMKEVCSVDMDAIWKRESV